MPACRGDAVVGLVGDDAAGGIVDGVVPGLDRTESWMQEFAPRALRRPVLPSPGGRVAAVEDEAAARAEVQRDGPQRRRLIFVRQEDLEGMAGAQDWKSGVEGKRLQVSVDVG